MTTITHQRSTHIDAPVETVFDYVEDPHHFFAAMAPMTGASSHFTNVTVTPEGVGSTYEWSDRMFLFPIHGVTTREEYVPNERIVDHSSTGPTWTFTFEPDPTGTTLTLAYEYSLKVPLVGKAVDALAWNGDRDIDAMLAYYKREIET
ncbi:MAG TPA: SRPBCC family protein [Dermatophilaceae bacterium]|nr:SRPBCC family protein [Dermatophilaceae bacterium]